jgi:hypothetical protein
MEPVRIILSGLWVATMLIYLLGDVLRIFAADFKAGELAGGFQVMVVLSLTLKYPAIRWVSIVVAIIVIVFNLFGLPYPGAYDNFLIIVSFVFNALVIWYAWNWV